MGPWDMPLGHGLGHILPIVQNASAASTLYSRVLPFHPIEVDLVKLREIHGVEHKIIEGLLP